MRTYHNLVVDTIARDGETVTSGTRFASIMAESSQCYYFALVEEISGTYPIDFSVALQNSGDGENWETEAPTAYIISTSFLSAPTGPTPLGGFRDAFVSRFVRLVVALSGTNAAARVRIWATGRSDGLRDI